MSKLIIIGGLSRTGKSLISRKISRLLDLSCYLSADALVAASLNLLVGKPYAHIHNIDFQAQAKISSPGDSNRHVESVKASVSNMSGSDLAWESAKGLIDHYDLNDQSILIEGVSLTPERINSIKLKNLELRAVFLGYSKLSHSVNIINYAKDNPVDWINVWLKENDNDLDAFDLWVKKQIETNNETSRSANKYGYGYFDITSVDFKKYQDDIIEYILS